MTVEVYNPQLGYYVVQEDRRFPQLSEHPGFQVDPAVRAQVEVASTAVDARFRAARYPLFIKLSENQDSFAAQVTFPPEITINSFTRNFEQHDGIQVSAHPTYSLPMCESAVFVRTERSLDPSPNGVYPDRRLQFGTCAISSICNTVFLQESPTDEPMTLESAAIQALSVFDDYIVGNELYDYQLSNTQRANIRRMAIIFGGYYLLGDRSWTSRAPTDVYIEEHGAGVPDIKSKELIAYTLEQSVKVAKTGKTKHYRNNEDYERASFY